MWGLNDLWIKTCQSQNHGLVKIMNNSTGNTISYNCREVLSTMLCKWLKLPLAATLCTVYLNSVFTLSDSSLYTSGTTPKANSLVFDPLSHWTVLCLTSLCFSFFTWNFIGISKELHCQQSTNCLVMFPILQQAETCLQNARVPGVNFSNALLKIHG